MRTVTIQLIGWELFNFSPKIISLVISFKCGTEHADRETDKIIIINDDCTNISVACLIL